MSNLFRDYFYYSKRERNGILVLVIICVGFFLLPVIYKQSLEKTQATDFSSFKKEIAAFVNTSTEQKLKADEPTKSELFFFDPNTVSKEELEALGFSSKAIRTFLNFRSKGGRFFKKEDFKKVYTITEVDYERVKDFIRIAPTPKTENKKAKPAESKILPAIERFEFNPNLASKEDLLRLGFSNRAANNLLKFRERGGTIRNKTELSKIYGLGENLFQELLPYVILEEEKTIKKAKVNSLAQEVEKTVLDFYLDINVASKEDWQKLYGIGPYFANSIVKYREKLGGFYSIDQIGETYSLPDSTFLKIRPQLRLISPPEQLNINTLTTKELAQHPYLKFNQAKVLVKYREQHGAFKKLEDLHKIIVLDSLTIKRISPYLKL